MPSDDAQDERVSLALYGGALAAIAILLVAGLFYARSAMQLFDTINQVLSPVEVTDDPSAAVAPIEQPTVSSPSLTTQLQLLIGASIPGSILIGWALGGGWLRGTVLVLLPHAIGVALLIFANDTITEGSRPSLLLLLIPCMTALIGVAMQWSPHWFRRLLNCIAVAIPIPVAIGLTVSGGWWALPLTWLLLPPLAALAPLLMQGTPEAIRE